MHAGVRHWFAYCTIVACTGCGAARTRVEQSAAPNRGAAIEPIGFERVGSPIVLARSGNKTLAYIADADDSSLHVVDVDGRRELATTDLPEAPTELIVTGDARLIALFRSTSRMQAFRLHGTEQTLEAANQVNVPTDPVRLALSADEKTLFVTSAVGRTLSAYGAGDLHPIWKKKLEREPWGIVLSDDGRSAFVSHAVGGRVSVVSLTDTNAAPRVIDIVSTPEDDALARARLARRKNSNPALPDQPRVRLGLQNFSLAKSVSPEGRILVPGVLVDPGNREVVASGYGDAALTELANIAVLDADRTELIPASVSPSIPVTLSLGWGERPPQCLLPRAATVDPMTGMLLVACAGLDTVMAFDAASADPRSAPLKTWPVAQDPIGIAIDADRRRAVIWSQQKRSVSFIDLDDASAKQARSERLELSVKARYEKDELAFGRALFNLVADRRISADGRGCASCHVDGRDDGLTWATPGGPRQTPALAGRVRHTEPFGWDGEGKDLENHLSHTFVRLRGGGLSERELAALMAYVESLTGPAAPAEELAASQVARGRTVFASAETGCAACHNGPTFSDGLMHDVGSRAVADQQVVFNTPSLLGVGASAPYFHDGRFSSLEQMLIATSGHMGNTKHLARDDFYALVAYLESL